MCLCVCLYVSSLDKFFTLVRRFVAALFTVAKTQAWSQEATAAAAALIASPLLSLPPNGLRYHTTDLFITELRKVDAAVPATAFLTLLRPFLALLHQSDDAPLFKRVVRDVFTPILDAEEARLDTEGDAAATRTAADAAGACFQHAPLRTLLPELQKIAGDQDTRESQRSKVYALLKRVRALVARLPKEEEPTAVATPGKRDRKSKKKTKKPKSAKKAKKTPKKAHKEAASTPATTGRLSGAKRRRSAVEEAVGAGSVAAEDDNDTGAMATHRASKKARAAKDTPSAGQAKKMKKKAKKAKKATKQQASQDQEEAPATPRSPPPTSMASSEETSHTPAPKSVTRPKSVVWSTKKKVRGGFLGSGCGGVGSQALAFLEASPFPCRLGHLTKSVLCMLLCVSTLCLHCACIVPALCLPPSVPQESQAAQRAYLCRKPAPSQGWRAERHWLCTPSPCHLQQAQATTQGKDATA